MVRRPWGFLALIILVIVMFPAPTSAKRAEIRGDYCYQYGDSESLVAAKEIAFAMALRKAIETYKTFVTSTSVVNDFQIKKDLIETIVSGYVEDVRVVRHDIEGRKVCTELVGYVDSEDLQYILSKKIKLTTKQQQRGFQGIINNFYLKVLNYKIDTDSGGNKLLRVFYQIKQSPPPGGTRMAVFCFDHQGDPIQTSFCDIVASSSFIGAFGEQSCVIPSEAVSINISF